MHSLAILDDYPYPARNGTLYPIAAHLSQLAELGKLDLVTTIEIESSRQNRDTFRRIDKLKQFPLQNNAQRILGELLHSHPFFTRARPDFSTLPTSLREEKYDVIYTSPAWLAGWHRDYPTAWKSCPQKVLCLNDCITERFVRDRILATTNFLSARQRLRHLTRSLRLPWMARVERKLIDQFDVTLVQSQQDVDAIIKHCGEHLRPKLSIVSNGIKNELLDLEYSPPEPPVLLHLGALFGNRRQLLVWFLKNVFTKVVQAIPGTTMRLCGKIDPQDFETLRSFPGVVPVGFVDSLEDAFRGVSVSIAPLLMRTGLMNKVTDSLAAGVPCTGMGAFGGVPGFQNEVHGIECESAEHWVQSLIQLLKDRSRLTSLSIAGRQLVRERLDWSQSNAAFRRAIGRSV